MSHKLQLGVHRAGLTQLARRLAYQERGEAPATPEPSTEPALAPLPMRPAPARPTLARNRGAVTNARFSAIAPARGPAYDADDTGTP